MFYFFDKKLEESFKDSFLAYPKRVTSRDSAASDLRSEEGRANRTVTLHKKPVKQAGITRA